MNYIDCHSHLTDLRLMPNLAEIIRSAQEQGIQYFMQGGVDPADWQRQLELKKDYPGS
ncbi:MAG: TatD family hydrolase, partial [Pseudobdellovibrionaceae bacterium]